MNKNLNNEDLNNLELENINTVSDLSINNEESFVKPMNNDTIIINTHSNAYSNSQVVYNPNRKLKHDPSGKIPSGIYGVIKWEKLRILFGFVSSSILILSIITMVILISKVWHLGWFSYVPMLGFGLYGIYKFLISYIDFNSLNKSVNKYRQTLELVGDGSKVVPSFIPALYLSLHHKQVRHIWFTVFTIFYGGIFTLIIYFAKDWDWWFFHFNSWIKNWLGKPMLVVYLMSLSIVLIAVAHVYFMVARKKRISDIVIYFGQELTPESEMQKHKSDWHKFWRRVFILSVVGILIIPSMIIVIIRLIRKRRK